MDVLHVLALTWLTYSLVITTIAVAVFQALFVLAGPALLSYVVLVRPYLKYRRG